MLSGTRKRTRVEETLAPLPRKTTSGCIATAPIAKRRKEAWTVKRNTSDIANIFCIYHLWLNELLSTSIQYPRAPYTLSHAAPRCGCYTVFQRKRSRHKRGTISSRVKSLKRCNIYTALTHAYRYGYVSSIVSGYRSCKTKSFPEPSPFICSSETRRE